MMETGEWSHGAWSVVSDLAKLNCGNDRSQFISVWSGLVWVIQRVALVLPAFFC